MELITSENILIIGSTLLIAGVLIGKSSYKIGLPLLLIFLLVGMGFGTDGIGIQFSDMHTAQFIGMIALCIILFSGGMGTKLSAIRPVIVPGLVLSTVGVLLTALLTGLFIFWLSGMEWSNIHFAFLPSLLLAATMSSTDSASVFGILGSQKVGLRNNLRPMLELESGSNDPMAYMLTIILIEALTNERQAGNVDACDPADSAIWSRWRDGVAHGQHHAMACGGIPPYRQQCRQRRGRRSGHRHDLHIDHRICILYVCRY